MIPQEWRYLAAVFVGSNLTPHRMKTYAPPVSTQRCRWLSLGCKRRSIRHASTDSQLTSSRQCDPKLRVRLNKACSAIKCEDQVCSLCRGECLVVHARPKNDNWKIWLLVLLVICLAISLAGMEESGNRQFVQLLALSSGAFCIGSCLWFWVLAVDYARRQEQARREQRLTNASEYPAPQSKYVARHAMSEKVTILCLLGGLASVMIFFLHHPASMQIWLWTALAGLFILNCIYAYRICMTTIRFENDKIFIRIAPFVAFSERYDDISEIRAKQGVLELHFADGKTIRRWSGLGDSDKIAEILMQKTDVLPH